jgi:hypothetical protein
MAEITREFDSVRWLEKETDDNGSIVYRHNGVPHRLNGPAMILSDGTKMWFRDGKRHREDGPAIEYPDGSRHWYRNDVLHRNLPHPAIEEADGTKQYYKNGILITEDQKTAYELHNQQRLEKYRNRSWPSNAQSPFERERERSFDR